MTTVKQQTLREQLTEAIRGKIIRQELQPGKRIIEQDIAKEFETSRGPVREALRDLENEGLIEYTRNVGCTVKQATVADSYEVYLLRATYETTAVKMMNGKIPQETIRNMESILESMEELEVNEYEKIVEFDNAFHEELVSMTGLERMHKAWKLLGFANIITEFTVNLNMEKRLHHQYPSHKIIIDLCKKQDTKEICKAISQHYWRTISRIMDEQGTPDDERRESWDFLFQ